MGGQTEHHRNGPQSQRRATVCEINGKSKLHSYVSRTKPLAFSRSMHCVVHLWQELTSRCTRGYSVLEVDCNLERGGQNPDLTTRCVGGIRLECLTSQM